MVYPRAKRKRNHGTLSQEYFEPDTPVVNFVGHLQPLHITIEDKSQAETLWRLGSYGVGSQSRRGLHKNNTENVGITDISSPEFSDAMFLTLEEAMFLSYALGCLSVKDSSGVKMTIDQMWTKFCGISKEFPVRYCIYHHFKCKGWTVKDGSMYGGDFTLYAGSPEVFHSQYIVLGTCVHEDTHRPDLSLSGDRCSFENLTALDRVATSVSKVPLLCSVIRPRALDDKKLESISCLDDFLINETLLKRWALNNELSTFLMHNVS